MLIYSNDWSSLDDEKSSGGDEYNRNEFHVILDDNAEKDHFLVSNEAQMDNRFRKKEDGPTPINVDQLLNPNRSAHPEVYKKTRQRKKKSGTEIGKRNTMPKS